jgi:hypothetical protein
MDRSRLIPLSLSRYLSNEFTVVGMTLLNFVVGTCVWWLGNTQGQVAPNGGFWTTIFLMLMTLCFFLGVTAIHAGIVATTTLHPWIQVQTSSDPPAKETHDYV